MKLTQSLTRAMGYLRTAKQTESPLKTASILPSITTGKPYLKVTGQGHNSSVYGKDKILKTLNKIEAAGGSFQLGGERITKTQAKACIAHNTASHIDLRALTNILKENRLFNSY
ncbi:MAG: hypothetical protein ACJAQ0_000314 [Dasania sp.]|jgi:hypothetical protein